MITDDFVAGVERARRATAGFQAFTFSPFHWMTLIRMASLLPALEYYRPMPHPDSTVDQRARRFGLPLNASTIGLHHPFWDEVAAAMKSDPVRQAFAAKLEMDPADLGHPAVALIRDLPGYQISIHPDSQHKIATVQIYLASHTDSPHIGVRLYRQSAPRGEFVETAAIPYLPGSGYFFRRSDASWHGVSATSEQDGDRNSLMLVYFDSAKNGFS